MTEQVHPFVSRRGSQSVEEDKIVEHAMAILRKRLEAADNIFIRSKEDLCKYICTRIGKLEHESFGGVFLGVRGELIAVQELFRGSLSVTATFPREMAKAALAYNAHAVVIYHNHPCLDTTPSQPDIDTTRAMDKALDTIGVVLLDHIIVAGDQWTSLDDQKLMPGNETQRIPPELERLFQRFLGRGIDLQSIQLDV